jgi:hypothetical protein
MRWKVMSGAFERQDLGIFDSLPYGWMEESQENTDRYIR